ncbi:hypothetical protein J2X72_000205 [Phyllobacterium sp. 1468]|nr:hypothetical protein [Phyllobacterium sp. 1468]
MNGKLVIGPPIASIAKSSNSRLESMFPQGIWGDALALHKHATIHPETICE